MKTVRIFGTKDEKSMPQWWKNFMQDSNLINGSTADINNELTKYSATFRHTKKKWQGYGDRYVDFDTEEDYLAFVLKWS